MERSSVHARIIMKKYIAECLGTFVLTLFGCGTAMVVGGATAGTGIGFGGVLTIALAFGLSIVACAYAIGNVSGCHINPAVSLGCFVAGKMNVKDLIGYVISQFIGGFIGAGMLYFIVQSTTLEMGGFGTNGYGKASALGLSAFGAIVVEIILTFVFVLTILGVTSDAKCSNIAGIVIGLTLTFVHIIGIPLTGTSVNPARSIGVAFILGGTALKQSWVFLFAPLIGAALAALAFRFFYPEEKKPEEVKRTPIKR